MIVEVDVEKVKQNVAESAVRYQVFAQSLMDNPIILMSADKYFDIDMTSKEKLEYILYADIIICMRNLGHEYHAIDYESMPLNLIYNRLVLPHLEFGDFLLDFKAVQLVKNTYKALNGTELVGNGELKDLNIPNVLRHTPMYDLIPHYYEMLFLISKNTTLVDQKIDMDEFVGLYNFSKFINIENL